MLRSSLPLLGVLVIAGCFSSQSQTTSTTSTSTSATVSPDVNAVTGTISYRERMAIPVESVVDIWITDVTPGMVAQVVTAEISIATEGQQVPIPFELRYDPSRIAADHTYALSVAIRSGGEMLFQTEEAVPVITQGNPKQVSLWLARADLANDDGELIGTTWRLEDLAGAGVVEDTRPTLEFLEVGKVAGSGSCNRFFGSVLIIEDSIQFGPLGSTQMACADAVLAQEARYLRALQGAERYMREGTILLLHCEGLQAPLRFRLTTP